MITAGIDMGSRTVKLVFLEELKMLESWMRKIGRAHV